MFYNNYVDQCNKMGLSPSAAAEAIGFKRSVVTRWANGTQPRQATLQKIASFFGCSVEDLTKEKEPASSELVNGDAELTAYLEELKNRSEMRMLFHTFSGASKEQIEAIVKAFESMQGK